MPAICSIDLSQLYKLSEGSNIGLSPAHFAEALSAISLRFLPPNATSREQHDFYKNLHLKDLALAQACSRGVSLAWEHFQTRYRENLYTAALVLTKNDSIARELADSLFGDLFATQGSKLSSYSGRGSLEGWLKAVLAHAYVDRYRAQRRVVSLDQRLAAIGATVQYRVEPTHTVQLHRAIEEACLTRTPEQRFLLAAYFCDEWTLAEIAKSLGVHESTVSRRMDRVLRELRRTITANLRKQGISLGQIEDSLQAAAHDLPFEIRGVLLRGINLARE